jgi:hypothetical protein
MPQLMLGQAVPQTQIHGFRSALGESKYRAVSDQHRLKGLLLVRTSRPTTEFPVQFVTPRMMVVGGSRLLSRQPNGGHRADDNREYLDRLRSISGRADAFARLKLRMTFHVKR